MPHIRSIARAFGQAFVGPQLWAFIPALSLCAFWFGGEVLLLTVAIVLPTMIAFLALLNAPGRKTFAEDRVTGLPPASYILESLDTHFSGGDTRPIAALAIEIDGFNNLVDRQGPGAGDTAAQDIAQRMQAKLRADDILARKGAGVFVAQIGPMRGLDIETMVQIAARLQAVMAEPVMIDELGVHLTLSIGFCLPRRRFEMCGEGCVSAAETALTEAKAAGTGSIRGFVPRSPSTASLTSGMRHLGDELEKAFAEDQMEAWFQPQVSTDTGLVSGMEALVRWNHPNRGILPPSQFLGAIAASGLARPLSDFMIGSACAALVAWDKAGLSVPSVSVNFSERDLADPMLADRVEWALDQANISPDRLGVEILETVIAQGEDDAVSRTVTRLAALGCRVELDDFGTGHAAIANLRRYSVSRIKIDRCFVSRIDIDPQQRTLLSAILDLAERLGIETLAEGVETKGEHALLAQLGCRHIQGYAIARPMPRDVAARWMQETGLAEPRGWPKIPRTG